MENYQTRLGELNKEEIRGISCSYLSKEDDEAIAFRESLGIFGGEETDYDKVWKIKCIRN